MGPSPPGGGKGDHRIPKFIFDIFKIIGTRKFFLIIHQFIIPIISASFKNVFLDLWQFDNVRVERVTTHGPACTVYNYTVCIKKQGVTDSVKNASARTKKIEGVGIERSPQNPVIVAIILIVQAGGGALTGICPVWAKAFLDIQGGEAPSFFWGLNYLIFIAFTPPVLESLEMGSYAPLILKSKLCFFEEKDFIKS